MAPITSICHKALFLSLVLIGLAGCAVTKTSSVPNILSCNPIPSDPTIQLCFIQPEANLAHWYLTYVDEIYSVSGMHPDQMGSFSFSPSGNYISVSSYGEGHPYLQVYSSRQLTQELKVENLVGWTGYPGWVSSNGWKGDSLLFESNVPLHEDYDRTVDYSDETIYQFRWSLDLPHPHLELLSKTEEPQREIVIETICEPIGRKGGQLELCADNRVGSPMYYQTSSYYLKKPDGNQSLRYGGLSTYRLTASPNRDYIVTEENAGEGHGMFSVTNLDDIRVNKENPAGCGGWDDLVGYEGLEWHGEQLYFNATQNLLKEERSYKEEEAFYHYRMTPADSCRLELLGID